MSDEKVRDDFVEEVVSALKKIEWAGVIEDVCWECCLFCKGVRFGPLCVTKSTYAGICSRDIEGCYINHEKTGHKSDCEWVRLMTKAGAAELVSEGGC